MNLIITLLRKPPEDTVARNVLQYGTGGLNIDSCRIVVSPEDRSEMEGRSGAGFGTGVTVGGHQGRSEGTFVPDDGGRWPANVILSNAASNSEVFPQRTSGSGKPFRRNSSKFGLAYGEFEGDTEEPGYYGDTGSVARFFFTFG